MTFSHVQTVFIVACGPSLADVDLLSLQGRATITINRAFQLLPDARIVWFSDWRFYEKYRPELQAHRAPLKATFADLHGRVHEPWVTTYRNHGVGLMKAGEPVARCPAISTVAGELVSGTNGGYAAIGLAIQQGAQRIVLLGYDMCLSPDGRDHYHEPHPWKPGPRPRTFENEWLPRYRLLADHLKATPHSSPVILNATPGSALDCFPRVSLADCLMT